MSLPAPSAATALIAEDEPLLAAGLAADLRALWPGLDIVATVGDGQAAVDAALALKPEIAFLDIRMPGLDGLEAAAALAEDWPEQERFPWLVFVTAYEQHALAAFEREAVDYLVKPVAPARLAQTVARLVERLRGAEPAVNTDALLQQLVASLQRPGQAAAPLRWIRASIGQTLRLIPVEEVDYLRSDSKYTLVAWRGDAGVPVDALVALPLKELVAQLDPTQFAQVHRSVVVNLRAISHIVRGANETADIHLKGRTEVLPVSRTFLPQFRQM